MLGSKSAPTATSARRVAAATLAAAAGLPAPAAPLRRGGRRR